MEIIVGHLFLFMDYDLTPFQFLTCKTFSHKTFDNKLIKTSECMSIHSWTLNHISSKNINTVKYFNHHIIYYIT